MNNKNKHGLYFYKNSGYLALKMNCSKNILTTISGILIAALFSYGFYSYLKRNKLMNRCSNRIPARIIEVKSKRNQGDNAKIYYSIKGLEYKSWHPIGYNHKYNTGDSIWLKYACEDPTIIRIISKLDGTK